MQFVVVRLGKDSVNDIASLDAPNATSFQPFRFDFTCTQVEESIEAGNYVFIWLGSDNNKGQQTAWKQGARAIGRIISIDRKGGFNDPNDIKIEVVSNFPESIDQFDFLERSATHYKYFSKYPVVGVKSSRNNAIQKVNEGDRQNSSALLSAIAIMYPGVRSQLESYAPDLVPLLNFIPVGETQSINASSSVLDGKDDEVWDWISDEIFKKNERNFLFLGAPGTGKTWYAREIATKLCEGKEDRQVFVQFHPSFSYDDFIEGYSPKLNSASGAVEYQLLKKHFLNLCERAKSDGSNLYIMVVDELTRGDPSRVFGELLTYLESGHRNRKFSLSYSGADFFIPSNLVVIATANPFDRSVSELDDALLRRFSMREFKPDKELLASRISTNGASDAFVRRIGFVFELLNEHLQNGFGHSHFWNVGNEEDFRVLWNSRIQFMLRREFQFDESSLSELLEEVEKVFPEKKPKGEADNNDTVAEADVAGAVGEAGQA